MLVGTGERGFSGRPERRNQDSRSAGCWPGQPRNRSSKHAEPTLPELWISSVFFWNAPNGVWHDDFADFDLWLRQNIGSQT